MRVPVFAGPWLIDICTSLPALHRYLRAKNARVRKRKQKIVKVILVADGDDSSEKALGLNSLQSVYNDYVECRLSAAPTRTLKRADEATGGLVKWSDKDRFAPGRFNPDSLNAKRKHQPLRPPLMCA